MLSARCMLPTPRNPRSRLRAVAAPTMLVPARLGLHSCPQTASQGCTRARPSNPATASGFLADRAARSTRPSWRRVLGPALCPHGSNTSFLYRAKSFPCVVLPLAARFMGRPILSRPCRRQGRPPASAPPVTTPAASWLLPLDFVAHSLSRGGGFHSSRPSRVFHRTVALW